MEIENFTRRTFNVQAVRVTNENIGEIAKWCNGDIRPTGVEKVRAGVHTPAYIDVIVAKFMRPQRDHAYVGDWVVGMDVGGIRESFKVYRDDAFKKTFRPAQNKSDRYNEVYAILMEAMAKQDAATYHEDYTGMDIVRDDTVKKILALL